MADRISRPQPSGTPRAGSTSCSGGESGAAGSDCTCVALLAS